MNKINLRAGMVVLAVGLWIAALSQVVAAQDVERGGPQPTATPEPATLAPGITPTPDRLAPPPTVPSPNQADEGAQLFWLHCQPCHGDRGQGLTDEWRAQHPPDDRNCWESGCHGDRPYNPAFKLPAVVPAVIGDGTLQKFETMQSLYGYVSVAMPYFFPGDLTQEEYLAIIAHIARENGLWDGQRLTTENLASYRLRPAGVGTAPAGGSGHLATAAPADAAAATSSGTAAGFVTGWRSIDWGLLGLCTLAAVTVVIGGILIWRNRSR